jgi:manganese/iron transport system substrate-binding protein
MFGWILRTGNGGRYLASANDYQALLHGLDIWIQDRVAQIPQADRKLVTDHMALAYFAERYGFDIVGAVIPSYNTTAEVSAQELVALQQTIRAAGVQAIFVSVGTNPAISQQLSIDLGLHLVPIYIGALSDAVGPAASYIDLMHYNVEAIVDALLL